MKPKLVDDSVRQLHEQRGRIRAAIESDRWVYGISLGMHLAVELLADSGHPDAAGLVRRAARAVAQDDIAWAKRLLAEREGE